MFKNKTLLITGGTGSFGNAVLRKFLSTNIKEKKGFRTYGCPQHMIEHQFQAT